MKVKLTVALLLMLCLSGPTWGQMRKAIGGTPTINSCGASASISGKDELGVITVTTNSTNDCLINFSQTYNAAPHCIANYTLNFELGTTTATSTVNFHAGGILTGTTIYYICIQP